MLCDYVPVGGGKMCRDIGFCIFWAKWLDVFGLLVRTDKTI